MRSQDLPNHEQGCLVDCIYCKYIEPKYSGTLKCPVCHGKSTRFQPARMMDRYTSEQEILSNIFNSHWDEDPQKQRDRLLNLLNLVDLYNFDFKLALINKIKELYGIF
jgi:hypothetical protein